MLLAALVLLIWFGLCVAFFLLFGSAGGRSTSDSSIIRPPLHPHVRLLESAAARAVDELNGVRTFHYRVAFTSLLSMLEAEQGKFIQRERVIQMIRILLEASREIDKDAGR